MKKKFGEWKIVKTSIIPDPETANGVGLGSRNKAGCGRPALDNNDSHYSQE